LPLRSLCGPVRRGDRTPPPATRQGAVLLEVVLALVLFFAAMGVILAGLHRSILACDRLRLEARAGDLAVTLLSEVQMGLVPPTDAGPEAYTEEDLSDWTWQIITTPVSDTLAPTEGPEFRQVEIVIANPLQGYTCRLVQLMPEESSRGRYADRSAEATVEVPQGPRGTGLEEGGRP